MMRWAWEQTRDYLRAQFRVLVGVAVCGLLIGFISAFITEPSGLHSTIMTTVLLQGLAAGCFALFLFLGSTTAVSRGSSRKQQGQRDQMRTLAGVLAGVSWFLVWTWPGLWVSGYVFG
jgi:hypothetical protein